MAKKGRSRERFSKDISSHIGRRKPKYIERTIIYVLANEVVTNVDMFSARWNSIQLRNDACTLIVAEDWEGMRNWKVYKVQEKLKPEGLFERVG